MTAASLLRLIAARVVPFLLLAGSLVLVFSRLRSPAAILPLWRPWTEVGVLAFGMTAILLTGGIDLSVGSIVGLSGVIVGLLWKEAGVPIWGAALAGVVVGTLAGGINGLLITRGIAPLVATLATMALYAGLSMSLTEGVRITGFPSTFTSLGQGSLLGLPNGLWLLLVAFVVSSLVVHGTKFGRYLVAIGDNRQAAGFAAVPVDRVEWRLYAMNGCLAGLVALWYTSRRGAAVADAGAGLELQAIACAVLGGTRVTGGSGGIGKTLLGLAVLAHLEIGLRLWGNLAIPILGTGVALGLNANVRLIVVGLLLIIVAVFNERLSPSDREFSR